MPSSINPSLINVNFPIAGINQSSQGFRDNYITIQSLFNIAKGEISSLQSSVSSLSSLISTIQTGNGSNNVLSVNSQTGNVIIDIANLGDVAISSLSINQLLQFNGSHWTNYSLQYIDITSALEYAPLNQAGGTMTGALVNNNGFIGNASTASNWANSITITVSGDTSGSVTFDGSSNSTLSLSLSQIGTPGTYTKVITDSEGRVTYGTSLTSSDITNALGYTPSNTSSVSGNKAILQAQWCQGAVVQNGTFYFLLTTQYAGTINSMSFLTLSETSFTVDVRINSIAITGLTSINVNSATPSTVSATGANTFSIGAAIIGVISNVLNSPTEALLSMNITWS
jgi:hypothetical protein